MPKKTASAPSAHPRKPGALPAEPFFLEYATKGSLGWFIVKAANISEAVDKATGAMQGLKCTSAALRQAPDRRAGFGQGTVLALYTPAKGWKSAGAGLGSFVH